MSSVLGAMADARRATAGQHLDIDLNEAVRDPDLGGLQGIDVHEPVRHPVITDDNVVDLGTDVQEDVFDHDLNNNPVCCWDANEEDQEEAPCEPDLKLNGATNDGQVVLLPDLNEIPGSVGALRTRKHYSDDIKRAVYAMLLEGSRGGNLPKGLTHQVSLATDVSLRCVQRIWNAGHKGGGIHAIANKKSSCGRKRIQVGPEAISAIPLRDRTTLENVARHLGMAKSTVFRRVKEGRIERHPIAIRRPLLRNEDKKRSRAQHCREMLESQCSSSSGFKSNYDVPHMDKKWFDRTKSNRKYFYCIPGEEILKEQ